MIASRIQCQKKGCPNLEEHLHHYVPKCLGGKDIDGRVYLCKKHHDILHQMLLNIVFRYLPEEKKEDCKGNIITFSKWWVQG